MVKQFSLLLVASMITIAFVAQFGIIVHSIEQAHFYLTHTLSAVFAAGRIGLFIRETVLVVSLPLVLALIPAFAYWLVKRRPLPVLPHIVWVIWLILITTIALQHPHILATQ